MTIINLGKNHLRWCYICNLPILESKKCPICGFITDEIPLTPPSDARPAFDYDINFIRKMLDTMYGCGTGKGVIPDKHIVILNKAPSLDRMDEIIIDGAVIASIRYDIGYGWKLIPRMQGAYRISKYFSRGYVVCDDEVIQFIREGKNLMVPGVIYADPKIREGDEVIIISNKKSVVATGMAKISGYQMTSLDRGVAVKTKWYKYEDFRDLSNLPSEWDSAVLANIDVIKSRVSEAVIFIKKIFMRSNLPAIVSFSGGKDSLTSLLLTIDAGLDLPVLFINTGLEFDETVEHVHDVCSRHKLNLIEEKVPKDTFFGNLIYFGPPAKDYRWCCKTNKLGPAVNAISRNFPNGVLSFIGQRKYESETRNSKPRVWNNPWTPGQIGASPIQNWSAMHVWLYIFYKKEPFNVWYTRGLDRIGCFLCPASDLAEFDIVACSKKWDIWNSYLDNYVKEHGLPNEWKEFGLWRWKTAPKSLNEEIKKLSGKEMSELTKQTKTIKSGPLTIRIQDGYSPCVMGYSLEAALSRPIDLKKVKPFCHALGWEVVMDSGGEFITADYTTIYREGSIICKSNVKNDARAHMNETFQVIIRAEQCVGCGLCVARCTSGALYIENKKVEINEDKCIFCKDCFGPCPSVNYQDHRC